jgi:hypothetical protein
MCAQGARALLPADVETVEDAMADLLNYFRIEKMTPGSDHWVGRRYLRLRRLLDQRLMELAGCRLETFPPPCSDENDLRSRWFDVRKHYWQKLRDQKWLEHRRQRPLLDDESETAGVVYAYVGVVGLEAFRGRLLVKLGYCSTNLKRYLASKEIAHGPRLLAKTPGTKKPDGTEGRYLAQWNERLACGDEWFFPCNDLADWIKETFDVIDPAFDQRIHAAQASHNNREYW